MGGVPRCKDCDLFVRAGNTTPAVLGQLAHEAVKRARAAGASTTVVKKFRLEAQAVEVANKAAEARAVSRELAAERQQRAAQRAAELAAARPQTLVAAPTEAAT